MIEDEEEESMAKSVEQKRSVVVTHHNADLDALASMIAAAKLYDATPLRGRSISPYVQRYLALHKDAFPLEWYHEVDPETVGRVIVVDVRDARRLTEYIPLIERADEVIVYDHHPPSVHDLEGSTVQIEPVGACVTLLCEKLWRERMGGLSAAEATLMLLGLYADTGRLSFAQTTPRDVEVAAWLLRHGANLAVVNRYLEEEFTMEQRQLLMALMESCEEISVDAVEVAIATAKMDKFVHGAAPVIQRVMQMWGHDAIVGIVEFGGGKRVQVIGRSQVPYVNMGEMLGELGKGGGHAAAAACTIKKKTLEEVHEEVRTMLAASRFVPTRARDMMTSPVKTIAHDTTLETLAEVLSQHGIKGVPVMRDGTLCGMISRRDLERAIKQEVEMTLPVSARMSHEVLTIEAEEPLEDALAVMTGADVGRLPVMDGGELVGILSRADIIEKLYRRADSVKSDEKKEE